MARGGAAEFVEYRPYRQGDETGRIDWKLVARTNRVFTRLSFDQAILPTLFVLDASASMAYPGAADSKYRFGCQLILGLAAIARERGDPVGVVIATAAGQRVVPLQTRASVLQQLIEALDPTPGGEVRLAPILDRNLAGVARLVVLSDFLADAEESRRVLAAYTAGGGELYAIHIVAPGELDPDPARQLLVDPELPKLQRPMTASARIEYLRRFSAWRAELARDWRALGATYEMCVPGAAPIRQLIRQITRAATAR